MAVWLYAYGKNGLVRDGIHTEDYPEILKPIRFDELKILDGIGTARASVLSMRQMYEDNRAYIENFLHSKTPDEYRAHLETMGIPYVDVNDIVDYFIEDGEKHRREQKEHFDSAYAQFKNKTAQARWERLDETSFAYTPDHFNPYQGIRVKLLNDLVWVTGPSEVFSVYTCFLQTVSAESREFYHHCFKQILRAFNSDFILYAHEYSGLEDEEDKTFNLQKLEEQSQWQTTGSDSLHTMDRFYRERI